MNNQNLNTTYSKNYGDGFNRFKKEYGTCPEKLYESFIDGFFKKFQDSFFFVNLLQCFIVCLMYGSVGKGKYWTILFYASIAGCIGSLIENGTIAYICRQEDITNKRELYNRREALKALNLSHFIKHSSYTILVCVDVVSILLAIFITITQIPSLGIPGSFVNPLHCIKSAFILILACDALIFKYGASVSSSNASSEKNKYYDKTQTSTSMYNNNHQNNPISSVPSFNYSSTYLGNNEIPGYQGKGIIKNYINSNTTSTMSSKMNNNYNNNNYDTYSSQNFGFLNESTSQNSYNYNNIIKNKYSHNY
ncbi:hypothetical protein PIROE2DRAFT_11091 [Piromyces sp. E2]|nr:hypothetical protein PIROE2DRAFT_11091 [Piromyces sp. E2]|eukprot:OUM62605.1 hypothetical protein PIROE2DRAFT_11091 [Piromyces sp. E2]